MSGATLEALFVESAESAGRRERHAFDLGSRPIVLMGAGRLGRKMAHALRRVGVEPLAFADNDASRWGHACEGLDVVAPAEAAARWRGEAYFVVSISRGSGDAGMAERILSLQKLGCRWVVPWLPLAWRLEGVLPHNAADLPSRLLDQVAALRVVAQLWSDDASREVYRQQMLWRLRADFSAVAVSAGEQYRPPELFELGPGDRVVDGGAYNGDTLRALGSAFAKAWAIEPDPANAARLRAESDERVVVIESALGEATSDARFSAGQGVASTLSSEGNISVRVSTLDDLLEQESPTFVKLDIEGAEFGALAGSRHLLARSQPIVAVCVYHRPDDIWRIPLQLRDLVPHHRYFLRAHEYDGFEVVAYAVPPNRLLARPTSLDSA